MRVHVSYASPCKPICALGPLALLSLLPAECDHPTPHLGAQSCPVSLTLGTWLQVPFLFAVVDEVLQSFASLPSPHPISFLHDLGMATEPDDYQTISDNCPGYMVLISEGIICTRCAGEKRHKRNDCPKPAAAAALATDNVPGANPDGTDNADSGMESLSDTSSVSSESTAHSDSSDMMRGTTAHPSDQGGNHSQDIHLPRRGFARPDASYTSIQPDRTSPLSPNHRPVRRPNHVNQTFSNQTFNNQIFSKTGGQTAAHRREAQSRDGRDILYAPNPPASAGTYFKARSTNTSSGGRPFNVKQSSIQKWNGRTKRGIPSRDGSIRQVNNYEVTEDRLPSKSFVETSQSLADTTGKFEYSNTTCPSSFGFGRLPSEAMG